MEQKTGRISELDAVKGLGLLYVMSFHFLIFAHDMASVIFNKMISVTAVMIIFFLASGYSYRPGKTPGQNIYKRIITLLKPFIIYTVAVTVIYLAINVWQGTANFREIGEDFYYLFAGKGLVEMISPGSFNENLSIIPAEPYWFLRQLILMSLIFYPLVDFVLKKLRNLFFIIVPLFGISALLCAFCPQLPWDFEVTPALAAYMLIGAWCGKKNLLQRFSEKRLHPVVIALVLIFTAAVAYINLELLPCGQGLGRGYFSTVLPPGPDVFAAILTTALTVLPFIWLSCTLSKTKVVGRFIVWLGRNSLSVYLVHMLIGMSFFSITGAIEVFYIEDEIPYRELKYGAIYVGTIGLSCAYALVKNKIVQAIKKDRK